MSHIEISSGAFYAAELRSERVRIFGMLAFLAVVFVVLTVRVFLLLDRRRNRRRHHTQCWPQLRHELQYRRKSGPERRQRHAQDAQSGVPHCADRERILTLRDEPILQRALGQLQMLSDLHF